MRRTIQLFALLLAAFANVAVAAPSDQSANTARTETSSQWLVGLPQASAQLQVELADGQRFDGDDGRFPGLLPSSFTSSAPAEDDGRATPFDRSAGLSDHVSASHRARAPPQT